MTAKTHDDLLVDVGYHDLLAEVERLRGILHDHLICPECGWMKCYGECTEVVA